MKGVSICPNTNIAFPIQNDLELSKMTTPEYAMNRPCTNPFFMHSGPKCAPVLKEEGPIPILGNVGALITETGFSGNGIGTVGGGKNRSALDEQRLMKGTAGVINPEIFGASSFHLKPEQSRQLTTGKYILTCNGSRTNKIPNQGFMERPDDHNNDYEAFEPTMPYKNL